MDARRVAIEWLFQRWSRRALPCAKRPPLLNLCILLICGWILVQAFALEAFHVPTGSMAPALMGDHRACTCPSCGTTVVVGKPRDGRHFSTAVCPDCGETLHLGDAPEASGDQVLVNKAAFAFRRPRRWEIVVFRLFGVVF